MSFFSNLGSIPQAVLEPVFLLVNTIARLLKSAGDAKAEEEALMAGQEDIKAYLDKRKFG